MRNIHIKLIAHIDAHTRAQISTLIQNPYQQNQLISIGYDSFIRAWHISDLCLSKSNRIISPYLTSIVPFHHKFIVGIGNGSIVILNHLFQIQKEVKLHEDCVTSILILPKYIVTTSYDGNIKFVNKQNFQLQQTISLGTPIEQCLHFQNTLYIAANPSFKIDLTTLQQHKIGHYRQFIIHKNQIFGCNDEQGLTYLTTPINFRIPCNFMMSLGQYILISSEQGLGIFSYNNCDDASWKICTIQQFSKGCSMLSGVKIGNFVFLAGESGEIYKIQIISDKQQKQQIL